MSIEIALFQWEDGLRRLREAPPAQRQTLERVVATIVDELRRRLGGVFTAEELAELYASGTDWTTAIAQEIAPGAPWAWDAAIVTDAAFARYLREATDYSGGRLRE